MTLPQQGYLVLADISGYTAYLAGVELDHAQDIMASLLGRIVERLSPPLTIEALEGDAVFAYAPAAVLPRGETLLELLELTYAAFRDDLAAMARRTTCTCRACANINSLDLKFVAHFGRYFPQVVAKRAGLVGPDVILAHRLLKNGVSEATGWRAYILFTAPALARLGLDLANLHRSSEHHEHLGEIGIASLDLRPRYRAMTEARRVYLGDGEADGQLLCEFAAPPATVWAWLNDPEKRTRYSPGRTWRAVVRPGGRTQAGARNHCAHGKQILVETILDWRPFDYYTAEHLTGPVRTIFTYHLTPVARGTRLRVACRPQVPLPRWGRRWLARLILRRLARLDRAYATMATFLAAEHAVQPPATSAGVPPAASP